MAIELYRSCRKKIELNFNASDTEKSQTIYLDGQVHHVHVRIPNFTNSITATFSLQDQDGYSYLEQSGLTKNNNHNLTYDKPLLLLGEGGSIKITLSGAPGSPGTITTVLYYYGKPENP